MAERTSGVREPSREEARSEAVTLPFLRDLFDSNRKATRLILQGTGGGRPPTYNSEIKAERAPTRNRGLGHRH